MIPVHFFFLAMTYLEMESLYAWWDTHKERGKGSSKENKGGEMAISIISPFSASKYFLTLKTAN